MKTETEKELTPETIEEISQIASAIRTKAMEWSKELRTTDKKQGVGYLFADKVFTAEEYTGYCCLGILCGVLQEDSKIKGYTLPSIDNNPKTFYLRHIIERTDAFRTKTKALKEAFSFLRISFALSFDSLNDSLRLPFPVLASFIDSVMQDTTDLELYQSSVSIGSQYSLPASLLL